MAGLDVDIQEIIRGAEKDIEQAIITESIKVMRGTVAASISNSVGDSIKRFMDKEVIPELNRVLQERKAEIIQQAVAAVPNIMDKVVTHMSQKMVTYLAAVLEKAFNSSSRW